MDSVIGGFLERNLSKFKDDICVTIDKKDYDEYKITFSNGKLIVEASSIVAACMGIYDYLKKYCGVQLSWCSNTTIDIDKLTPFDGELSKRVKQKFRVYMNYCTLDYTMCWWNFERWEKEIDFMAMNGINMPLAVVGTEAVWFETLLQFGFTEEEALSTISGPAFWAWQLMTNIEGYNPPKDKKYVYERLELGRKILNRFVEFGMQPIQQGFSGHVPMLMKKKFPKANIHKQIGWCMFPRTAQLDPLDGLFFRFGTTYLRKMKELFGNYHYIACDPFHEGVPPKLTKKYLNAVGTTIDNLYYSFDKDSVWVMQAWTIHKNIVCAVPKDRLLLLDLDSDRANKMTKNLWGYDVVAGMLHNFGGKNAMQGKLKAHCKNKYLMLQGKGASVVGSGMFMEGVEQNPVIYDLQFSLLTAGEEIDSEKWLDNYIERRYKKFSPKMKDVWNILLETCYKSDGYKENKVGSAVAARPAVLPVLTGPCCYAKPYYDTVKFETAAAKMLELAPLFYNTDSYQYDLCDMVRQALSNRFYTNQVEFKEAFKRKDLEDIKRISKMQLELLLDLDFLLSHRSEMTLSRWINDAHNLATDEEEKKYFDYNARLLLTSWGDIRSNTSALYDYAWREWSGLIKEYYYVRWDIFYSEVIKSMEKGKRPIVRKLDNYATRLQYRNYPIGKKLDAFETQWIKKYSDYPAVETKDVIPTAQMLMEKWKIGNYKTLEKESI